MNQLIAVILALSVVVLSFRVFRRPGIGLGICWSMLAFEAVMQQSNAGLMANSMLTNFLIAGIAALGTTSAILNGHFKKVKIPSQLYVYILLLGLCALSLLWTIDVGLSMQRFQKAIPYIVVFALVAPMSAVLPRHFETACLVTIYFGGMIVLAIFLGEQGDRGRGLLLDRIGKQNIVSNPLAMASYAGIVCICALFSMRNRTNKFLFMVRLVIVLLSVLVIIKSGSRGQLIALALACFIWLPIVAKVNLNRRNVALQFFGVILVVGIIYAVGDSFWTSRWETRRLMNVGNARLSMATEMLHVYSRSDAMGWFLGLGTSASFHYLGIYPHNVPVETLVEEGICGAILFLILLSIPLRQCYFLIRKGNVDERVRSQTCLLMTIITFHGLLLLKQGSLLGSAPFFGAVVSLGWIYTYARKYSYENRASVKVQPGFIAPNMVRQRQ